MWIGLRWLNSSHMEWLDGSAAIWTNTQVTSQKGNNECCYILLVNQQWYFGKCSEMKFALCEIDVGENLNHVCLLPLRV